jgi:hypothetical protein
MTLQDIISMILKPRKFVGTVGIAMQQAAKAKIYG